MLNSIIFNLSNKLPYTLPKPKKFSFLKDLSFDLQPLKNAYSEEQFNHIKRNIPEEHLSVSTPLLERKIQHNEEIRTLNQLLNPKKSLKKLLIISTCLFVYLALFHILMNVYANIDGEENIYFLSNANVVYYLKYPIYAFMFLTSFAMISRIVPEAVNYFSKPSGYKVSNLYGYIDQDIELSEEDAYNLVVVSTLIPSISQYIYDIKSVRAEYLAIDFLFIYQEWVRVYEADLHANENNKTQAEMAEDSYRISNATTIGENITLKDIISHAYTLHNRMYKHIKNIHSLKTSDLYRLHDRVIHSSRKVDSTNDINAFNRSHFVSDVNNYLPHIVFYGSFLSSNDEKGDIKKATANTVLDSVKESHVSSESSSETLSNSRLSSSSESYSSSDTSSSGGSSSSD